MSQIESYQVIVLGGGKGGKTLAIELGQKGVRTALIERSAEMIGGSCINVACIPTKSAVQMAMIAGLPFAALRDAVVSHPTLVEGFNNLFANVPTGRSHCGGEVTR